MTHSRKTCYIISAMPKVSNTYKGFSKCKYSTVNAYTLCVRNALVRYNFTATITKVQDYTIALQNTMG